MEIVSGEKKQTSANSVVLASRKLTQTSLEELLDHSERFSTCDSVEYSVEIVSGDSQWRKEINIGQQCSFGAP